MRIRWTEPAAQDLYRITTYIRRDNPEAARKVARTIYDGCESLAHVPHRGRIGREPGTRELIFPSLPYIAVYRVTEAVIEITRIWHGAQSREDE
jgi:toxin ParE1/3/4